MRRPIEAGRPRRSCGIGYGLAMLFCPGLRLTYKLLAAGAHGVMHLTLWFFESAPQSLGLLLPLQNEPTMDNMAIQTFTKLTDDIDGSDATTSVSFALDGVKYEIDLSEANAAEMGKALAKYVSAARRTSGQTGRGRGRRTHTPVAADPKAIRAWAASNGIEVNSRGRISSDVVKQFEAANA